MIHSCGDGANFETMNENLLNPHIVLQKKRSKIGEIAKYFWRRINDVLEQKCVFIRPYRSLLGQLNNRPVQEKRTRWQWRPEKLCEVSNSLLFWHLSSLIAPYLLGEQFFGNPPHVLEFPVVHHQSLPRRGSQAVRNIGELENRFVVQEYRTSNHLYTYYPSCSPSGPPSRTDSRTAESTLQTKPGIFESAQDESTRPEAGLYADQKCRV